MAEAYKDPQGAQQAEAAVTCRKRYEQLITERYPFLQRARDASELTIPALMPPEGHSGATEFRTPFQSAGAEGVNSLASKLLLALLPPGSSFFRLQMDDMVREELAKTGGEAIGEIEKELGKVERAVLSRLEQVGGRISVFDALKHLIVCGNVLVQILKDGAMRLYYLDSYVVKRDPVGNVLEIITKETVAKIALPPNAKAICEQYEAQASSEVSEKEQNEVDVFTRIYRKDDGMFHVYQEIHDHMVPGTEGSYPLEKSAWLPLRWVKVDGQDYGRGRVEEFIGDIASLEALSQSVVEGIAQIVKIIYLVNEGGTTSREDLNDASNGDYIEGDAKDVATLQPEKFADLSVAMQKEKTLEERIAKNFLVHQQRNAERVTAEEVRAVIEELEKALGGVYAVLAQEFQLPLVTRLMFQMQKSRDLPRLPEHLVSPKIITGLDALGRGADFEKLRLAVADIGREFGPEIAAEYINVGEYIVRKFTALQIDTEGLVRSEDEVQETRRQKQQAELAGKLGPQLFKTSAEQQPQSAQAESSAA